MVHNGHNIRVIHGWSSSESTASPGWELACDSSTYLRNLSHEINDMGFETGIYFAESGEFKKKKLT
jgi:hypothetical protein